MMNTFLRIMWLLTALLAVVGALLSFIEVLTPAAGIALVVLPYIFTRAMSELAK